MGLHFATGVHGVSTYRALYSRVPLPTCQAPVSLARNNLSLVEISLLKLS